MKTSLFTSTNTQRRDKKEWDVELWSYLGLEGGRIVCNSAVVTSASFSCSDMLALCGISAAGLVCMQAPVSFFGVADNLSSQHWQQHWKWGTVHGYNIVRLNFYMIDLLGMSSSLLCHDRKYPRRVRVLHLLEYLHACLDCLFSSRLRVVLSTSFIFCQVVFSSFFWQALSGGSFLLLSCLHGFVWQARSCFPPHLLWWPLTTHLSRRIFTWHFFSTPWWIFHFSLPPLLTPCSNVVSISLYPFIFCQSLSPSYLSFVLLVASSLPAPEPLPLNVFFQFHILPLLFLLPVVSPISPSHICPSSSYFLLIFPHHTLACCHHHHNLLHTAPFLPSHFYAAVLSLICSLSASPTLPLAGVSAY